tara:strand:- start:552 stop:653 length:102 start_codon:yes stop_codon:yes gene_type:complete
MGYLKGRIIRSNIIDGSEKISDILRVNPSTIRR